MAYLNANIPPIYCKLRKEYLYDLKEHQGEYSDCVIFGLTSISGRALLFNIMLPNGACYWRLPISAFFQKHYDRASVPDMQTHELELWNSFSYWPSVTCFDWLDGVSGKNISVHIYWNFLTVIMQLSLITAFCGTLIVILLITVGQTIRYKLLIGMQKITTWLQKIVTACFIRWKKK